MFVRRQTDTLIKYFSHPHEQIFELLDRKIIDIPEARWLLGLEQELQAYNDMRKYK